MSEKGNEEEIVKFSPIEADQSRSRKRYHPFSVERILQVLISPTFLRPAFSYKSFAQTFFAQTF